MILEKGQNVLIVHRRLFEADEPRLFTGTVEEFENGLLKVRGCSWLRDPLSGQYRHKKDARTKIMSLTAGTLLVYELPAGVDMEALRVECLAPEYVTWLTDGKEFRMDVTEKPTKRLAPSKEPVRVPAKAHQA